MREWTKNGDEWHADECTIYVYLDNPYTSSTFNPERPYVVATVAYGEPTGEDGRYETFPTLQAALRRASFRHAEKTGTP